jgi:hypothetical protein
MATVKMIKGDLVADIFDSPETIAQARREGYSLVYLEEIEKRGDNLEGLTKSELLELARQKGLFDKSLATKKKGEIIGLLQTAKPEDGLEGTDPPARAELIQAAIAKGFDEASLASLSDEDIAALLEPEE